ncbi:MAG: hypothetical protein KDC95_02150 [Planctomycetes bacterium]|nr:hypothetical protein [Planctomycetota bacterium]
MRYREHHCPADRELVQPRELDQACDRDACTSESGVALIIAIFFTIFGTGLILSGLISMNAVEKETEVGYRLGSQARQFATAGLIDGLAWFRRQTTQPVTSFDPVLDTTVSPPIIDTIDPTIGIVREFEISGGVWGRYELRRFVPNVTPTVAEVADVSTERRASSSGTVWRLVSRGFVFRRVDPLVAYNVQPNHVLGQEVVDAEIRRMTLAPPAQAALCSRRADNVSVGSRGRIRGGSAVGVVYKSSTGSVSNSGEISGAQSTAGLSSYADSVSAIFGVTAAELRTLADDRVSNSAAFPSPIPVNQIIYAEADLVFDASRPLRGLGIVYVDGDVDIQSGSNSFFNGLLVVTGNLKVNAPALLRGSVVVWGKVTFSGLGDYSELEYDDSVLNSLMQEVGQYRRSSTVRKTQLRGSARQ